jgi:DNA adenine methylase
MATVAAQLPLFNTRLDQVINVATVRQLSPFRYPGGKTWLVPRIRAWLHRQQPEEFIEPFAGGGIVSLSVAAESLAQRVTMVELDEQVAAVWQTILNDNQGEWLAKQIIEFDLSLESLRKELARPPASTRERAFQTILKNRTHHGGILAAGAAPLKHGENGKGVKSRWYAETLRARILALAKLRERINFIAGDGLEVIKQNLNRSEAAFFIDPPYTAAGKRAGRRLYNHHELDHEELFDLMAQTSGDFLMTYDNASGVWELARRHGFDCEPVAMKNTHHTEMTELLIGRNLGWARMEETAKCV